MRPGDHQKDQSSISPIPKLSQGINPMLHNRSYYKITMKKSEPKNMPNSNRYPGYAANHKMVKSGPKKKYNQKNKLANYASSHLPHSRPCQEAQRAWKKKLTVQGKRVKKVRHNVRQVQLSKGVKRAIKLQNYQMKKASIYPQSLLTEDTLYYDAGQTRNIIQEKQRAKSYEIPMIKKRAIIKTGDQKINAGQY